MVADSQFLRRRAGGFPSPGRWGAWCVALAALCGALAGAGRAGAADEAKTIEGASNVKQLPAAAAYEPKENVVDIELSQYAGYAGLVAANGGLEPNDNSVFAKKHKFKLRIKLSEEESWPALQTGKMAASATTVDVLAVYGRQFKVTVPAQIGYSRGADAIVVRSDIAKINSLKGKAVVTSQFTESDFMIRYLAQEAGLTVNMLKGLDDKVDPDKLNLVFCADGEAAGELFLADVKSGANKLAGCVTWEPETSKVVTEAGAKAKILTTNRNLLIVADILVVNKGYADAHPDQVCGLVEGLLEGNKMVRENPTPEVLKVVGDAFKWDEAKTKQQLALVHLANLPENTAFFSGSMDSAGSFNGIFTSATLAYGAIIKDPADSDVFASIKCLQEAEKSGMFKEQKVAIAALPKPPAANTSGTPTNTPAVEPTSVQLLSKDIRFYFQPNSSDLDMANKQNLDQLKGLKQLLTISPGSHIVLRGHVDNAKIPDFQRIGGDDMVKRMAGEAMKLSTARAAEIKKQLVDKEGVTAERLDTVGRGWEEPAETTAPGDSPQVRDQKSQKNRRVEAQWFTLE